MQDIQKHNLKASGEWHNVKRWFNDYVGDIDKISETTDVEMFKKRQVLILAIQEFIEDIESN